MAKIRRALFVVCLALIAVPHARTQKTDDTTAISREILSQSGLRFTGSEANLMTYLDKQASTTNCESLEIGWASKREKEMVLARDAELTRVPQEFVLISRSSADNCGGSIPPFEFASIKVIVFGVTEKGEIRGLQVIPHMRDPRLMIVECPELFGQKSKPGTQCGEFIQSKSRLNLRFPVDSALTRLEFFERVFTSPTDWRLEKLGVLRLPPR